MSNVVTITVNPAPDPGVISGAMTGCTGNVSGTLVLTGHEGSVVRWEKSTDGNNYNMLFGSNGATSHIYDNLQVTTYYRAVIGNESCSTVFTDPVIVEVIPNSEGGVISPSNTVVCQGSNAGILTLTDEFGEILHWIVSEDPDFGTFDILDNQTNTQDYTDLTQTLYYKAVVQNPGCDEAYSETGKVQVNPILEVNAAGVTGCASVGSIVASATGGDGFYLYSIDPPLIPQNSAGEFANLPFDTYTIFVEDGMGCTAEQVVEITSDPTDPVIKSVDTTETTAIIKWQSMGSGATYTFRYRIEGTDEWTTMTGLNQTFVQLTSLQNNTTYEIQVKYSCSGNGFESEFSTGLITEFKTPSMGKCSETSGADVPIPGGVYVDNVTTTTAIVHWNVVEDAAGYIITYGIEGTSPATWEVDGVCHPTEEYLMNNLEKGQNYVVQVRTNCSSCIVDNSADKKSLYSPAIPFSTPAFALAGQDDIKTSLQVYPNPNRGNFVIQMGGLEKDESLTVVIYDLTGKRVYNETLIASESNFELPVSLKGISKGVYLLEIQSFNDFKRTKIVIE